MARNKLFLPASMTITQSNAPVIAIKLGETGYYPIHTKATVTDLNGCEVPEDIMQAALMASMFGWDSPKAQEAMAWMLEH